MLVLVCHVTWLMETVLLIELLHVLGTRSVNEIPKRTIDNMSLI